MKEEPLRYRIVVEWSDEDRSFVGRVPALPGCIAHGPTADKAAREAQVAMTLVLETLQEHGQAPPSADTAAD